MASKRLDGLADRFEASLAEAAQSLADQGFSDAGQIRERILKNSGFRLL